MAITWTDDNTSINNCQTKADWTGSGFSNPDDNNSGSSTPVYREDTGCMMAAAGKETTGYWYDTINADLEDVALVWWIWFSGPTELSYFDYFTVRMYDGGDYVDYDFLPEMTVLDKGGWFPAVAWPTPSGEGHITNSGTPTPADVDELRITADQINTNYDVKLVAWDYIHSLGYIGAAGDTVTLEDFALRDAAQNFGVVSQVGTTFQAQNILRYGGTGTTNVDESGKTLTFKGANEDHPIGFVFHSGGTAVNITWTDMVFNCQKFVDAKTAAQDLNTFTATPNTFKQTGNAYNDFRDILIPADIAPPTRWHRYCKFKNNRDLIMSDGEFTDCTVDTCRTILISDDAELTNTVVLTSSAATDESALEWNGTSDPDGYLDGMTFTKGTNAHHAIAFAISTPLTMTLTGVDVSGFNASNGQNDSTLHIKRTTGTVTVNLVDCTGDFSYKSAGATVIVQSTVVLTVTVKDEKTLAVIENAQTSLRLLDSPFTELMNEDTNASGVATESYGGSTPVSVVYRVRKSEDTDDPRYFSKFGITEITSDGLNITVLLEENPFI